MKRTFCTLSLKKVDSGDIDWPLCSTTGPLIWDSTVGIFLHGEFGAKFAPSHGMILISGSCVLASVSPHCAQLFQSYCGCFAFESALLDAVLHRVHPCKAPTPAWSIPCRTQTPTYIFSYTRVACDGFSTVSHTAKKLVDSLCVNHCRFSDSVSIHTCIPMAETHLAARPRSRWNVCRRFSRRFWWHIRLMTS